MGIFYTFNRKLEKIENFILSWSIILMAALLIFNAIARTVFGFSVGAINEISVYLMMFLTFIGLSNAARKGKHIIMSAVLDVAHFKVRKAMMIISDVVTIIFIIVMIYLTANYTVFVYSTGRLLPSMGIPMWTLMIAMPIGFILGLYQYILTLIANLKHKGKIFLGPEVEFLTEREEAQRAQSESNSVNFEKDEINSDIESNTTDTKSGV